ncbi:MAG: thymidine kinase [Clostridiales bacterium]|nr:thymidine kinase [Clostridiales bacterium]
MAKLYFRYGVMGSSKTANALMVRYNYEERGQEALMVKPALDQRDGQRVVASRIGLAWGCIYFHEFLALPEEQVRRYACIIVDEAQFLTHEDVDYLTQVVDLWNVPVICYGLRTDFKGELFPGSQALMASADIIEEIKTICWCGRKATYNARFDEHRRVLKEGEQVVLGANDKYIGLCRRHWRTGDLGPEERHDL